MNWKRIWICATVLLLTAAAGTAVELSAKERLGKLIFEDSDLSTPPGQACANCHEAEAGFADDEFDRAVSQGIIPVRFGNRNAPSAAYASFIPDFHFAGDEFKGGQFWDGRAENLVEQAKLPFLNPLEMNNPDKKTVIQKIRKSEYADLFKKVYGKGALINVETAYDNMADAIATFEGSAELNKFTSKFDKDQLEEEELEGKKLFIEHCNRCHEMQEGEPVLFTDFDFENIGAPSNLGMKGDSPDLKFYYPFYYPPLVPEFNPDGLKFVDKGLGGFLENHDIPEWKAMADDNMGKFKVPTLRNIANSPPYMHNGVFTSLEQVVHFYNTRDVLGDCAEKRKPKPGVNCWPLSEVPENVDDEGVEGHPLGNLGLSDDQEEDIVAFMETLTDDEHDEDDKKDDKEHHR